MVLQQLKSGVASIEQAMSLARSSGLDSLAARLTPVPPAPQLRAVIEPFLRQIESPRTKSAYATGLRYLTGSLGPSVLVDQIGSHHIDDILTDLRGRGLSANTVASAKTAWSALFTWLRRREQSAATLEGRTSRLPDHPVQMAKTIAVGTTRHRFLTPSEFERFLDNAIAPMRAQYATLALCGLRIGEFIHLRPQDVDLSEGRIKIRAQEDWAPKGYPRYTRGVGDIPIHRRRLLPLLNEYRDEWAGTGRRFFVNPRSGRRWSYDAFRRRMMIDTQAIGLVYGARDPEGVSPHTFRHTLASWLAQRDVQLKKIALILRDTVETVDERYAHLLPTDLDHTIQNVL